MITNIKTFGEFNDFSVRTEGHKLYGEIVAKIFDEVDDTAEVRNFPLYFLPFIDSNYGIKF